MAYTTIDDPTIYFDTKLYTGTGSNNITLTMDNVGWVWMKNRTNSGNHILMDIVRGGNNSNSQKPVLLSNTTGAEQGSDITATGGVAFGSTSTVIGSDNGGYNYNNSTSSNYVAWHWGTGTSFTNDASATSIGTIDSAGSSNQEAGFSIVSWTGNATADQSVAHNLGGVPEMIISKNRVNTSTNYNDWTVYHHSLATANDKKLRLNTTDAVSATNEWGDTDPTSTVFSVHTGGDGATNDGSDTIIAYCFRSIKGYSKFGTYEGNGNADGTYVHLGFQPAFLIVKPIDAADNWVMFDNKRLGFNSSTSPYNFYANTNGAETTDTGQLDFVSNGFKIRNGGGTVNKTSTYIFMAFASNPFVTSTGVPATAR